MSKKHKNNFYQTEYSLSFNWKPDDQTSNPKLLKTDIINRSIKSQNVIDRKTHQFRHRLKLALLEKLDKLESEFVLNNSKDLNDYLNCSQTNHRRHSHRQKSVKSPVEMDELSNNKGLNKRSKSRIKNVNQIDWQNELRRSRSLAMEFKHKNESTQIWWLTESIGYSSSDESIHGQTIESPIPFERLNSRMSLSQKSQLKANNNSQMIMRRNSVVSYKALPELSQSSFKSSLNCQIAQATGYQSTTDDLSSFNHDTDTRSIERFVTKRRISTNETLKDDASNQLSKLKLPDNDINQENCYSSRNKSLVFYGPYQTEDFNKDTSSDSNMNNSLNLNTYRID